MNTIKIKYGIEDIKSRIPGLFPYLEYDDNNVCHLHKSSDSKFGCYNKIPTALTLPIGVSLEIDGETILYEGHTYTYRTLINYYYQYKEYDNSSFIVFMNRGIGKIDITLDDINSTLSLSITQEDLDGWQLVHEYFYLAECAEIYDRYSKMSIACEKYIEFKEATGEFNCELECLLDKYRELGGDIMRDYYKAKSLLSETISNEFLEYVSVNDSTYSISLNIVSSEDDLGVLSSYLNYWEPLTEYAPGDIVVYDDWSWICVGTTIGVWDDYIQEFTFDYDNFKKLINGPSFCGHTDCSWVSGNTYVVGDLVTYPSAKGACWMCVNGNSDTEFSEDNFVKLLDKVRFPNTYALVGTSDSKLSSFIKSNYVDEYGNVITNSNDVGWLYYFRKGNLAYYETTNDTFNNIAIQDGYNRITDPTDNPYETHLMAYGNIMTDITYDSNDETITFTYVIGANLKARLIGTGADDDGNTLYYYGDYEYNSDDSHGVTFTETYRYDSDGEIAELINDGNFNNYVSGNISGMYYFYKFEFDMSTQVRHAVFYDNGYPQEYDYIESSFIETIDADTEDLIVPTFRTDYLIGVSYPPISQTDIYVGRGNAAAWERHFKLGEVKSFDDLENYSNGGFFNIV